MDKKYHAVIVSPHLDDAVFSCGGLIANYAADNKAVLVINIFTDFPQHDAKGPVELSERRYEEERDAAELLDFDSINLDQLDAVLRQPEYRAPQRLFGDPITQDEAYLHQLRALLEDKIGEIDAEELYLPLAVGWHVDHTLTFLATARLASKSNSFYYEDAPYCLWPHTLAHRLSELDVDLSKYKDDGTLARHGFLKEWLALSRCWAGLPPMVNFKPALVRPFANLTVSAYFVRLLSRHRKRNIGGFEHHTPHQVDVTKNFSKKIDACYLYRSQIDEFYLSKQDCQARYKGFSDAMVRPTAMQTIVERYWGR